MNKLLLSFSVFITLSAALAENSAPVDCATVNPNPFYISYYTKAVFPNPAQFVSLKFDDWLRPTADTTICGHQYHVTNKGLKAMRLTYLNLQTLLRETHYKFSPLQSIALIIQNISMGLSTPYGHAFGFVIINLNTGKISYKLPDDTQHVTTMAVKINKGPLKPLYFDGKSSIVAFPKDAVIDVYASNNDQTHVDWVHTTVNIPNHWVETAQEGVFPAK